MGMSNDDMIDQLRRRKVPYDYELDDSIDYAISCIKARDSLESTARKYRKLQKEYKEQIKSDIEKILRELQSEFKEELRDTKHLHYNDLEQAESYNTGIEVCTDLIQNKIDTINKESEKT